jgi:formate hydrogenlyase subunit 3/multisubunit Na+/H+ antiporter MnhD subunit
MTPTQFLILLAALIPLVSCFLAVFGNDESKPRSFILKLVPLMFFTCLIALAKKLSNAAEPLLFSLGHSIDDLNLLLRIDGLTLAILLLLNFLWLIFVIYSDRFLRLYAASDGGIRLFFSLTISFLILLVLSGNLVTAFFFQSCLIFLIHSFERKAIGDRSSLSSALNLSLYLEAMLLFFAVIATQKFFNTTDFVKMESFSSIDGSRQITLLCLYISALFLPIIFGCFFLYRDAFVQPICTYSILFFQAFASFCVFLKLCFAMFDGGLVFDESGKNFWHIFEVIILANSILMLVLMFLSRNLKTLFFYLFFQQFSFAIFATVFFIIFDQSRVYLPLLNFSLLLTLVFFCLSSFILFLSQAENKRLRDALRLLKINAILLIFAVFALCGLSPSSAMVENFFLAKIVWHHRLTFSAAILAVNFSAVLVLLWKIFLPTFLSKNAENETQNAQSDIELAKSIDLDSALILTAVIVTIILALCPIFLSPITSFLTQNF